MPKRGRKRITNPKEHAIYMRGYRAGQKHGNKKGVSIIERAMEGMFSAFKSKRV